MAGHAPYIMPDGSSLAAVLEQEEHAEKSRPLRSRKGKAKAGKMERMWQDQPGQTATAVPRTQQQQEDLQALYSIGRERRRYECADELWSCRYLAESVVSLQTHPE